MLTYNEEQRLAALQRRHADTEVEISEETARHNIRMAQLEGRAQSLQMEIDALDAKWDGDAAK